MIEWNHLVSRKSTLAIVRNKNSSHYPPLFQRGSGFPTKFVPKARHFGRHSPGSTKGRLLPVAPYHYNFILRKLR